MVTRAKGTPMSKTDEGTECGDRDERTNGQNKGEIRQTMEMRVTASPTFNEAP